MNTTTSSIDPFEAAFRQSIEIRKCAYDPTGNFVPVNDEYGPRKVLSLAFKLTWFHVFCNQNGIQGRIEDHDHTIHTFDQQGTAMVTANAKVYFGNELIASAVACKGFSLQDPEAINGVVQAASGNALSKALSNAGFSTISAMEYSGDEATALLTPPGSNSLASAVGQTTPSYVGQSNTPTVNGPGPQFAPPVTGVAQTSFLPDSIPTAAANDPILEAKSLVYNQKRQHPNNGKTLGQILATNPSAIEWLAANGKGQYKEAASLLLPEALSLQGKPIPA